MCWYHTAFAIVQQVTGLVFGENTTFLPRFPHGGEATETFFALLAQQGYSLTKLVSTLQQANLPLRNGYSDATCFAATIAIMTAPASSTFYDVAIAGLL